MNFIIHTRSAEFVSLVKGKIALSSSRVYAIWMREIIEMMADSYIAQKHWHREMSVAIFMLPGLKQTNNAAITGLTVHSKKYNMCLPQY